VKVLICGSRDWKDRERIVVFLKLLSHIPNISIIHGAATGADRIADEEATKLGIPVKPMPADWVNLGKSAGPIRNISMLNEHPDLVVAFHITTITPGTADMIMRSRAAGIPVLLIPHV